MPTNVNCHVASQKLPAFIHYRTFLKMVFHADDSYTILPSHFKPRRIQPGKRTILVSVLLSVMLLMSQLFRALQLNHPPQLLNGHSMESLTSLNEEAEVQPCVKTNLGASTHEADSQHSCHHLAPPRGLCSLMQNLFFSSKPQTCQHQTRVTFCATVSGHISCESPALCASLTCEDIPLLQPNLCICKNFETAVQPTQFHMALADFGIGVLNNMILQQHKKNRAVGFGNCKPLKAYESLTPTEILYDLYPLSVSACMESIRDVVIKMLN
ncbi:hypothetical protein O3P69_002226 [Scylla paramamosain]|uniref:Uncharacterized protein n=1 Tax=Scylla paramamosain TaxID=85552 RepID=A0AAW0V856_SCYPA